MKNKLIDIHNMLVSTLEDLDNEELLEDTEKMKRVTQIAKAKSDVVKQIVEIDRLSLDAAKISHSDKYDFMETADVLRLN